MMLAIWFFLLKWFLFRHHVNLQWTKLATRVQTPPISPPTDSVCVCVNVSPNEILVFEHPKTLTLQSIFFSSQRNKKIPANQWRSLDDVSMIHGRKHTIYLLFFLSNCFEPGCLYRSYFKKDPENQHDWLENSNNLKMYFLFNRVVFQGAMWLFTGGYLFKKTDCFPCGTEKSKARDFVLDTSSRSCRRSSSVDVFFRQAELDTWKVYHPPWN